MHAISKSSAILRLACAWSLCCASLAAATSSGISPAITVDTRDTVELIGISTRLTTKKSNKGHLLVRRASDTISLQRKADKPAYLKVSIPEFSSRGGGWAAKTRGIGAFHGFEIVYQGSKNDRIYQKIGGAPPSSSTPDSEWKEVTPNRVMSGSIRKQTRYFKVAFAESGDATARFAVRFHSARLAHADGGPVTSLNASNDIWLVFHDADGGPGTLRTLHEALATARPADQVVTVDWASAAATLANWSQPAANASYFSNLGENLSNTLKQSRFKRNQVNLVGHGWGAVVAQQTAAAFGGCNRIIALDPTLSGAGAFDARTVRFSRVSQAATGIKSGTRKQGSIGDESVTTTADLSIRLLSSSHAGDPANRSFHHALPVDWLVSTLEPERGAYWPFFRDSIILRTNAAPELPWSATDTLTGGFQLECSGITSHEKSAGSPSDAASMEKVSFLAFIRNNQRVEARATIQDGKTTWKYRKK